MRIEEGCAPLCCALRARGEGGRTSTTMPKYDRDKWLSSLKSIREVAEALRANVEETEYFPIKGELSEEIKEYFEKVSGEFRKKNSKGM